MCIAAENPKEQEYLEKILMKLFYENKKAEKAAYNFLAVSHGKKETLKREKFRKQINSYEQMLEDYLFDFERFWDDNKNDEYIYSVIINGHSIKINDNRPVMAEIILH